MGPEASFRPADGTGSPTMSIEPAAEQTRPEPWGTVGARDTGSRARCRRQDSCHICRSGGRWLWRSTGIGRWTNVTEIGRGTGVAVTERGHDESVIHPAARSQPDGGPNLHPRCRTRGVSSLRASTYTPSHTATYTAGAAKSFHINRITTRRTTPHVQRKVQGGSRGATHRKTGVLRSRPVFLRHTCRAGSLPSKSSLQEGHHPRRHGVFHRRARPTVTSESVLFADS
jgi:hypothetical protein